jgi:hypothetical protein
MPKSIGFGFQRGRIRVAVLTDTPAITLAQSYKIDIDDALPLTTLMDRYKRDIDNELEKHEPDVAAVKLVFDTNTINAAKGSSLPCGILALACHERTIELIEYTGASFRHPGPFGLPADSTPLDEVEPRFGKHPPYWDKLQKEIIMAAWRALL